MKKEVLERITKIFFKNNDYHEDVTGLMHEKGKEYFSAMNSLLPHYSSSSAVEDYQRFANNAGKRFNKDCPYLARKYIREKMKFRIARMNIDSIPDVFFTILKLTGKVHIYCLKIMQM